MALIGDTVGYVTANPSSLPELWPVFSQLDQGVPIALLPPEGVRLQEDPPTDGDACLGVTSSGSTGVPRLVWRAWPSLKSGARSDRRFDRWCWASPYAPWTFAGVQVAVQAWVGGGSAVSLPLDWEACWQMLEAELPDALSATPTFVDLLLQNDPKAGTLWAPKLVVLGGEPLREKTGQRIGRRWPEAEYRVVYASAECGVILKTRRIDGAYEIERLAERFSRWRLSDGVLELQEAGTWRSTGDLVRIEGPLLRVVGRAGDVANIAGTKVSLAEVAELAEATTGVRRAVAVAEPSPVTGQVIALRYAIEAGSDPDEVLGRLQEALRSRMPKAAWPRKWVSDEVLPGRNAKRASS